MSERSKRCRSWHKLPFGVRRWCCLNQPHSGEHVAMNGMRWGEPEAHAGAKIIDLMEALKSALKKGKDAHAR